MNQINRPIQITALLNIISSADDIENSKTLETYIAGLESRQPNRPTLIDSILIAIDAQYPAEIGLALETYISTLESKQLPILSAGDRTSVLNGNTPRVWSGQRATQREQQRRERARKKQNNYQ